MSTELLSLSERELLDGLLLIAETDALREHRSHQRWQRPALTEVVSQEIDAIRSIRRKLFLESSLSSPRQDDGNSLILVAVKDDSTEAAPVSTGAATGQLHSGLELAHFFHETYERLAPEFGYKTREETRTFSAASKNGQLMIAVCDQVLAVLEK